MTLQQLTTRQATLLQLIANVGGRSNIRKWVDELMSVEAQIETLEAATPAVKVFYVDDIAHLTQPWVIYVGDKEVASFASQMKCDRHIAYKMTTANLISNGLAA